MTKLGQQKICKNVKKNVFYTKCNKFTNLFSISYFYFQTNLRQNVKYHRELYRICCLLDIRISADNYYDLQFDYILSRFQYSVKDS